MQSNQTVVICQLLRLSAPGSAKRRTLSDAERQKQSQPVSGKGKGNGKNSGRTLSWPPCRSGFRRLASRCSNCSRRCGHRLRQKVFGTYVKETLVNLARDAATDSGGSLRDLRQGDTCQVDATQIQEGAQGHQPDPG